MARYPCVSTRNRMKNTSGLSAHRCPTQLSISLSSAPSKRRQDLLRGGIGLAVLFFSVLAAQEFRAQQPAPPQEQSHTQPVLKRPQEGQPKIAVEVKTVSVLA